MSTIECSCGKHYRLRDVGPSKATIRCHICGGSINLKAIRERQEAESFASDLKTAAELSYAGLRFDGCYETSDEDLIEIEAVLAEQLGLTLRFNEHLDVEFSCRHYCEGEFSSSGGSAKYSVHNPSRATVTFCIDVGTWMYDMEAQLEDDELHLEFELIENVFDCPIRTRGAGTLRFH